MIRLCKITGLFYPISHSRFAFSADLGVSILKAFAVRWEIRLKLIVSWIVSRREVICKTLRDKVLVSDTSLAEYRML